MGFILDLTLVMDRFKNSEPDDIICPCLADGEIMTLL